MMKKLMILLTIVALTLTGTALAATYTDSDRDLTFEYDDSLFDITTDEQTDDETYVVLTGTVAEWGVTTVSIHLEELSDGETFPTVEDFSKVEEEEGAEVTQGEWNGFADVIMFSTKLEDGTVESVFIVPIYDDDDATVEDTLTVRINAAEVGTEEQSDAISGVLDSLKLLDD